MKRKKQYRFQKGGLAMAEGGDFDPVDPTLYQDEDEPDPDRNPENTALLALLTQSMGTSQEAKTQAQIILDNYNSGNATQEENDLVDQMQESADSTRATLKAARAKLMGEKYNDAGMWFKMAGALAAPTRTGSFFESAGRAADVAGEEVGKKQLFERSQDKELLGYDTAADAIDQNMISNRLKLLQNRNTTDAMMARAALGVLGKPLHSGVGGSGRGDVRSAAARAVDSKYSADYVPFISGGSAKAAKSLHELELAEKELLSGNDKITGPIVGSIRSVSIPYLGEVGDAVADILWPTGGNVKAMVEGNILESLRQVLGSQFTENEGKRILANTYNPRLDEKVVAKRVNALRLSLTAALEEKNKMAGYFQREGTLAGYPVKEYTPDMFGNYEDGAPDYRDDKSYKMAPPLEMEQYRMPNGDVFFAPKGATRRLAVDYYRVIHPDKKVDDNGNDIPQGHFRGGRVGFATGGIVDVANLPDVDVGQLPEEEEESMLDRLRQQIDPGDVASAPLGAGIGAMGGLGVASGVRRLEEMLYPANKVSPGEGAYLKALNVGKENISDTGAEVKRARRQGVPSTLMDAGSPATRALAERALIQGGTQAEQAIDEIETSRAGSRERVAKRVNLSLKPPAYFESHRKMTDALYTNAKPLYEAAYTKYPGIPESSVPAFKEIFDSPDGSKAVKIGLRLLRNQGKPIGKVDAIGLVHKPSLEFLDYVKRGFDQLITKEEKNGPTALGRSQRQLRNRLRDQLDLVAPEYKTARAQYAGDLEVLDALKSGREEFHTLEPEEIKLQLDGMSAAEKRAHRTGVAQHLFELIHGPYTDMNAARRVIGSPAMVTRLGLLFNKKGEERIFNQALEREMTLFDRQRQMHGRAERGRQTRMGRELATESSPVGEFFDSTLGKVASLWQNPQLKMSPGQADEVVEILRTGTPRDIDRVVHRLAPLAIRQRRLKVRRGRGAKIGAGIGALLAPFANEPRTEEPVEAEE